MPSNVLPLSLKQTFPPIIWIFTEGEGDEIESRLSFKTFFTLTTNRAGSERMSLPINNLPYHNSNSSDSNATGPKSESSAGNFNCFTEQKPEIRNQNQKNQNFGNNLNQNHNSHLNSAATSHIVQAASKPSIISRSHVIQPQQHHTRFAEAANSLNKSKHMRLFSRYLFTWFT